MSDEKVQGALVDYAAALKAAHIVRDLTDVSGKVVGQYRVHIALVPPEAIRTPHGHMPQGPMWTFNVEGTAGDVRFIIVLSSPPVGGTGVEGMEIVGAEMGKLLHGISHQVEAATLVAGSMPPGKKADA